MIEGLGNDIIEIDRVKNAIERTETFVKKVFTDKEIEYAEKGNRKYEIYAGRFAAKEAVAKAMGTGIKFPMTDIEILNNEEGKPFVELHNDLKEKYCGYIFMVTISHNKTSAMATAIAINKLYKI